jgi:capsular exopolysaccharide synthesis family protein
MDFFKKRRKRREINSYDYKVSKLDKMYSLRDRRNAVGDKLSFSAAEAYKLLRTNLILSMADEENCRKIGITSALRVEGKSTTAINLAYTLAEMNIKVLLIEADMRIPILAKTLRIDKTPGLSNVLAGVGDINEAIRSGMLLPTLSVIPAGDIPPNPSELISSARMKHLMDILAEYYEYIIVDIPPVNAVSDSLAISKLLSGMIVVVRQNYCDQHSLAEAMRQLKFLNVKILGFVMNDAVTSIPRYKRYKYRYKYKYRQDYAYRQTAEQVKLEEDEADA